MISALASRPHEWRRWCRHECRHAGKSATLPSMAQVTWRATDELVRRVQAVAAAEGLSMNELMTRVLAIATDSDDRDPAAVRLRERLRAAGMLTSWAPTTREPPDGADLERARAAAGTGTPLADIVSGQRR